MSLSKVQNQHNIKVSHVSRSTANRGAMAVNRFGMRTICFCLAATLTSPASAQTAVRAVDDKGPQNIVVTATRTGATRLQDTPIAITVIDHRTIERAGLDDVRDLATLTPNLLVTQNASFGQIYIRGVGSNNVFVGSDPSSTIHLDGVYLGRPASVLTNFLDVERIEVLRGPQGTLYGRNSVGGTINIISRKPGFTLEAKAQLSVGNYNLLRGEAYVSGPLVANRIAASVSVIGSRRNGYLANAVPGVGDVDDENVVGSRAQLRFTLSPTVEIIVRGDYFHHDQAIAGYVKLLETSADPLANSTLGDFRRVALNILPLSRGEQQGLAAEIVYNLGPSVGLTSLTSYRASRVRYINDSDGSALNVRQTDLFEDQHQLSQEFTLTGRAERLSYISGLYYFDERIAVDSTVTTFASNRSRLQPVVDTMALAGFGHLTYALTGRLAASVGIRYSHEQKRFAQLATTTSVAIGALLPGFPRSYTTRRADDAWTPKFGLEFRASNDVLLYAVATKGFKSGGFNFSSLNPAQGFKSEQLWSYEAGAKVDLFNRILRVNAAIFHYDYDDLQILSFLSPGVIDISNAADARVNGAELEAQFRPTRWLKLDGNFAYLDARYRKFTNAIRPGNIAFDASGNRLNLSPEFSYSLLALVEAPVGKGAVFVRGEYSYRTGQYFSALNSGLDGQRGYGLINASIGYTAPGGRLQLILLARNLADVEYVTSTAGFPTGTVGRVGEPRTFSLRAIARY